MPRLAVLLSVFAAAAQAQSGSAPTIDDLINLKRVAAPAVSPDGQHVAFTIRETNWDENAYETEIWIGDAATGQSRQVTNARKSSMQPAWSPDRHSIAFVSDRDGKRQLYRIAVRGGEAERLTSTEEGVGSFAFAPSGRQIAFTMQDAVTDAMKEREKRWGDVKLEDLDQRYTHLYVLDLESKATRQITKGNFVVGSFDWTPDSRQIAFDHRATSDPADSGTADISVVTVANGDVKIIAALDGPDTTPRWSPDGNQLAFVTSMGNPSHFYTNSFIATITPGGTSPRVLTQAFDEDPSLIEWSNAGVHFSASQRTWSYLFTVDPQGTSITKHAVRDNWVGSGFSITPDGASVAFVGSSPTDFPDVYVAPIATMTARKVSDAGAQIASWPKHAREVVRWKSQDGVEIEGVLHKPADFQAGRRYPLLVVIHGGPTGVSRPVPYGSASYYPIDTFLAKGALVLEPNYRGSAGYGERFRSLNVRNLGIGDAWDVLSGIDALVQQGLVDRDRVGSMGWSQGGYISAFLTTRHSDRFRAISVGAGISDWMTYYVNTDIHPFTRQYLKATPWDDPKIYADTSPMTYIKQARTPTLIQHGKDDARVPIPNAFQLYQGLRDQNVPVQLSIFNGFGHGLTRPKANRAAMQQNLDWFTRYIWNQPTGTQQ
ncbi:MAG TPA: S9 family peptidase [Vicinamibacterales bacterium]|nr:S9 family peptidase [Vicinamibacterales bacterium]